MKLTPIDIQQQTFTKTWRGVDLREVTDFLELVSGQFEELGKEGTERRERMVTLMNEVETLAKNMQVKWV